MSNDDGKMYDEKLDGLTKEQRAQLRGEPAEDFIIPATRTPEELQEIIARALNRERWHCIKSGNPHHYVCNAPLGVASIDGMVRMLMERGRTKEDAMALTSARCDLYI